MTQPPTSPGPSYNPVGGDEPPSPVPYTPGYAEQPYTTLGAPMAPPAARKRKAWPWVVGSIAAVVLLCCGIGIVGAAVNEPETSNAAGDTPTTSAPAATTAPKPSATSAAPTPTKTTPSPKPTKVTYKGLSERQWKLVAKNPDEYIGKTYIVYGVVTQFDAATGDNAFLANVGAKNLEYEFEYDINTMLSGEASKLRNVVEDDEFRATVKVVGSHSYDTQIGGNTTVPLLSIASIKVL